MAKIKIPGKVMLSGEYAVLHGGTAVMMPVPRYLYVEESNADRQRVYSPVVSEAIRFPIPEITDYEKEHPVAALDINDAEFFSTDRGGNKVKLGLGLSAAEAVGVVAWRMEKAGLDWRENWRLAARYAFKVHDKVQGGIGSGADIAACACGMPIKFRRGTDELTVDPIDLDMCSYPIPLKLVWTGLAADTRRSVSKFEKWVCASRDSGRSLNQLIESCNALAEAWFTMPQNELFQQLDKFDMIMSNIAGQADMKYKLPIHYELEGWASENGGRAKPTGAGGGDMALLLGRLPVKDPHDTVITIIP